MTHTRNGQRPTRKGRVDHRQWSATASTAKEQAVDAMKALLSIDAPDLHAEYRRRQS